MSAPSLQRVLAGIDFSDWTGPVLQTAAEVASLYAAELIVVHAEVFLPPPYFTERGIAQITAALDREKEGASQHLREVVARELAGRVPVETHLVEAAPVEGILRTAASTGADLIVLGTHGRSGLNRFLLGSIAENALRRSPLPVLTVRGRQEDGPSCRLPFRRILCPLNDSPVARQALHHAADLARRSRAELVLMTSLEEGDPGRGEDLEEWCAGLPESVQQHCAIESLVRRGPAAEQILQVAAERQSDLIVIGAQHRPFMETTIFGTTSVRVLRHARCPVLSIVRH